ncbi:CcoQ/FixQ family Cbb3-type cytochrome c oxidase assembly chaperone [Aureibaculum sp. 2210JD6-5]|uniref:CcoQ/FixQ family Cbb3-type cytochrome c oxidase assembly chaperone n=1 Tax=Aureibaculum sp. 2210JD6-5 TaxID=3103957 RepID=UPI002AAD57D0|nr:CcoQ/FixQ family Cbb3-type cytochrome c oxidase assembly chaperone [Aureibaculum sp. 2210JD6-5]MDY7396665.1 CcoQ/FixQ family Cbb3-type cytochrome c oxidase assembly chaperone [Aureibaculum sp. 2210JD6-5]
MLKYIKHHLDTMNDVEIYPIISLILFFAVFVTMLVHVMRIPKKSIENISNLPLEEDENINNHE